MYRRRCVAAATVCLILGGVRPLLRGDEATVRKELDSVLDAYGVLFQQSFALPVKCPEVNVLLSQQLAAVTRKAFGVPLQLTISHFTYTAMPQGNSVQVHLADVSPQQKQAMEQQANALVKGPPIGPFLEAISFAALREGVQALARRRSACELKKETAETADFRLGGNNQEVMPGLQLQETWFRFDRKAGALTGLAFRFANGSTMNVRLDSSHAVTPKGVSVPVPTQAQITQDALETGPGGMSIPAKLTVTYGKPTFRASP
ncbi:MAG: hypothetical protein JXR77_18735 [Lentisphaeria bacterium]|nr:hypothetical protein [Lentisphaeria bacterium]